MKRAILHLLLFFIGAGLFLNSDVAAQDDPSPFSGQRVFKFEPTAEDKVALVRRLMSVKRYQGAADLLEPLLEAEPTNGIFINLLRNCYDHLQQYAKAELLIRRVLEREPNSIGHRLYLAELLVKLDLEADALEVYDEIDQSLSGEDPRRTLILIKSLMRSGLDDEALRRIEEIRDRASDSSLLAMERGNILERQREYRLAALEYLPRLEPDTTSEAGQAEKRLLAMLDFGESSEMVEQLLKSVADSESGNRAMRLLADHYLKAGRFAEAFSYVLRQDSLNDQNGYPLVSYTRRCSERQCWPQVVQMAEVILQKYSGGVFEAEVSFEYARALAELDRATEAAEVYSRLFDQTPEPQTKADALYGLGVLYYDYLGDNDRALVYFDSVTNHYPRGRGYFYARKAAPLCHVREGRLDEAKRRFEEMAQSKLPSELGEEVAFYLGLIDFFQMEYDSAEAAFRKLIVDFPRGFFINDALQLVLAMGDARDDRGTLDLYSSARYLQYRGQPDSARERLYAMVSSRPSSLGDLALYRLIDLELDRADSTRALEAIDRLSNGYAESYYRPLGLKTKADLLSVSEETRSDARELYRLLLETYPNYPFVREVREKLRRLDEQQPVG